MSNTKRIETWVWVLVYAGLIGVGLGLAVQRGGASFGWAIAGIGGASVGAGALLVWIRSRIKTDTPHTKKAAP